MSVESGNKFDRVFWITVAAGRNLKSSRLDTIDAYVKIKFDCETFPEKAKTKVVESKNPDWNETFYFLLDANGGGSHAKLALYDEDTGSDDHKGDVQIPFPDLWEVKDEDRDLDTKGHLKLRWGIVPLTGINDLKAQNDALIARVAELEADDVQDELEKERLAAALAAAEERSAEQAALIESLSEEQAAALSAAEAQAAALAEVQEKLAAAEADDEADEAAKQELAAKLAELQAESDAAAEAAAAEKAELEGALAEAAEAAEARDAEAADLQAQLEAAQADDAQDDAAVEALTAQLEALKVQKAAAEQQAEASRRGLAASQAKIAALSNCPTTERAARARAKSLRLRLGGAGVPFAGNWGTKGLYAYRPDHPKYPKMAFFGRGGTVEQMTRPVPSPQYRP